MLCVYVCACICVRFFLGFDSYRDAEASPGATICPSLRFIPSSSPLSLLPPVSLDLLYQPVNSFCHFCFYSSHIWKLQPFLLCCVRVCACVRERVCVCSFELRTWASNNGRAVDEVNFLIISWICLLVCVKVELPVSGSGAYVSQSCCDAKQ